jgi:O-antigen/teichoic acid export membrane protein
LILLSLRRNFAYNTIGALVPSILAFLIVPLYVHAIGVEKYGLMSLIWLVLGYFGFLDLGLSRAAANALARLGSGARGERGGLLATAFLLSGAAGALGWVLLFVAGHQLFGEVVRLPASLRAEVQAAMPWVAGLLPLALLFGVAEGALESRERFFLVNATQIAGAVLAQTLPLLCALLISPSVAVLAAASFAARGLTTAAMIGLALRGERLSMERSLFKARVRQLLGYGSWITLTNLVSPVLASADQFLLGATLGTAPVAYYAVPMTAVQRSQILAGASARTLFPRLSWLDRAEAAKLAARVVGALGYLMAAAYVPVMILAQVGMTLWMGADFASHSVLVLRLLLVGAWINALAFVPLALIQAQGRPDLVAKLHLVELLPYLGLLWWLVGRYGVGGAALAWTLRTAIDAAALFGIAQLGRNLLTALALPLLALAGAFAATPFIVLNTAQVALLAVGMSLLVGLCGLTINAPLRQFARDVVNGWRRRSTIWRTVSGGDQA